MQVLLTLKIGKILFMLGFFLLQLGKKTYFLALGTIPVTGVGFIAIKITDIGQRCTFFKPQLSLYNVARYIKVVIEVYYCI